ALPRRARHRHSARPRGRGLRPLARARRRLRDQGRQKAHLSFRNDVAADTGLFGLSAKLEAMRWLAGAHKLDAESLRWVSLRDWLDINVAHRDVQDFLLSVFRLSTYINAPELASAPA